MGRAPCCDKANVKKGPWSPEEDAKLKEYIDTHGTGGNWISLPLKAGLKRCGKSCRLRWLNYLRPNIKHGEFSEDEDRVIINLFANIGSRWSIIAAQLPGRTDNDIKNYWNTKLKKKIMGMVNKNDPSSSSPSYLLQPSSPSPPQQPYRVNPSCHFQPDISSPFSPMNLQAPQGESFLSQMMAFDHQASSSSNSDGREVNFHGEKVNNVSSSSQSSDHQKINHANNNHHHHGQVISDHDYYGIEEIKQLISSSNSSNNCSNNFLLFDENKAELEKVLYYYY